MDPELRVEQSLAVLLLAQHAQDAQGPRRTRVAVGTSRAEAPSALATAGPLSAGIGGFGHIAVP